MGAVGTLVTVAHVGDVPPGDGRVVRCGNEEIALFNVDGRYYALSARCPHQGGPLADGWTDDGKTVTCPWHGWTFGLEAPLAGEDDGVCRYPVVVDGDDIKVRLPDS